MSESLRLGFLYPDSSGEDDLVTFASRLCPPADAIIAHTVVPEDVNREDALIETGAQHRLAAGAAELASQRVSAVIWTCTSASFVFGLDGARHQAAALAEQLGVPASSTSLAFLNALSTINAVRVAIASIYPQPLTVIFTRFLAAAGIDVVSSVSAGVESGKKTATMDYAYADELVARLDLDDADAVLLPCTALHTADVLCALERSMPCHVLTANQVTVWEVARLAGASGVQPSLGRLGSTDLSAAGHPPYLSEP
ncbi:MAG: maleate cis-trans isomerase [Gaiellaceae bacterium]|jgi:maleate cis-trans isomerase